MITNALLGNLLVLALRFGRLCNLLLAQPFDFEVYFIAAGLRSRLMMLGNFEDPTLSDKLLASGHVRALGLDLPRPSTTPLLLLEGPLIDIVRSRSLAHSIN